MSGKMEWDDDGEVVREVARSDDYAREGAADYLAMIAGADAWGPSNDPERRHFLAGWRDQADGVGRVNEPARENEAALCAYNSGIVAAREARH